MKTKFYNHEGGFFELDHFEYCIIRRPTFTPGTSRLRGVVGVVGWYRRGRASRPDGPAAIWGNRVYEIWPPSC